MAVICGFHDPPELASDFALSNPTDKAGCFAGLQLSKKQLFSAKDRKTVNAIPL
jgi:hypothetical protein